MALTAQQRRVLRELMAAPSYRRATPKARKALIEAGLVESNLSTPNQAHSDHDSEGVLQQRPSQGWGPTSESNTTDAEQFLRRAIPLAGKYGNAGELAQAVQRSAFPGRYNQRGGEAASLLGARDGGSASAGSAVTIPGQTITSQIPTVDQQGFAQAQQRSALGAMIARRNPNSFLLRSGLLSTAAPSLADFTGSKTITDTIPGKTVIKPASQIAEGATADVAKVIERANVLNSKHHPYKWGGGHQARIASVNNVGPVDCSGAVSAVLGINPRVSGQFTAWGKAGDGGSKGITVYANAHHVLMKINGHFFGTSRSNPGGGAGWIKQQDVSPAYLKGFTVRHAR